MAITEHEIPSGATSPDKHLYQHPLVQIGGGIAALVVTFLVSRELASSDNPTGTGTEIEAQGNVSHIAAAEEITDPALYAELQQTVREHIEDLGTRNAGGFEVNPNNAEELSRRLEATVEPTEGLYLVQCRGTEETFVIDQKSGAVLGLAPIDYTKPLQTLHLDDGRVITYDNEIFAGDFDLLPRT